MLFSLFLLDSTHLSSTFFTTYPACLLLLLFPFSLFPSFFLASFSPSSTLYPVNFFPSLLLLILYTLTAFVLPLSSPTSITHIIIFSISHLAPFHSAITCLISPHLTLLYLISHSFVLSHFILYHSVSSPLILSPPIPS